MGGQGTASHPHARRATARCPSAPRARRTVDKKFNASIDEAYADVDVASTTSKRWSNLDPGELVHRPGSVLGSAVLVAGTTIGAGILALPEVTKVSNIGGLCM